MIRLKLFVVTGGLLLIYLLVVGTWYIQLLETM